MDLKPAPPEDNCEMRFALAKALWEAKGDRNHAAELARQARDACAKSFTRRKDVAEVEAWLAAHGDRR
jgi:hypothetical protein